MKNTPRILVAPLNWGLGHATRCIPIIDKLLQEGFDVVLASDGGAFQLLQQEFPQLPIVELPAYNIRYPTRNMVFNIAVQIPKIILAIREERKFLNTFLTKEKIDVIISDNRYGCFSRHTKNIIITHQINIIVPIKPLEWLVNRINHFLINSFDECWIPDIGRENNLAGRLSDDKQVKKARYLGLLSRMRKYETAKKYDLVAILSGPEPQRTNFEKLLLGEIKSSGKKSLVVLGKPDEDSHFHLDENIEIVSCLNSRELNEAILSGEVIICRSGYSSIMDLICLEKQAILIPTPGQTEQEYLAERLEEWGFFCIQRQPTFSLKSALEEIDNARPVSENFFFSCDLDNVIPSLKIQKFDNRLA